jgi:hypothetical protein
VLSGDPIPVFGPVDGPVVADELDGPAVNELDEEALGVVADFVDANMVGRIIDPAEEFILLDKGVENANVSLIMDRLRLSLGRGYRTKVE